MKIQELLEQMTLDEKLGQLTQLPPNTYSDNGNITGPNNGEASQFKYLVGSTLGLKDVNSMIEVQKDYLENSRLKIPMYFANDAIHGYRTTFPIPLAQAASFNPNLVRDAATVTARECYYAGIHMNFSPMCDIVRDSRWGRVMESYGEDVLLTSEMVKATVEGYQQDGIGLEGTVASCIKHFLGYGYSESGRDYNVVDISRRNMHEFHLPPYAAGINSGAAAVMTAFNTFESVPISANKYLLQDILKNKLDFKGQIISDWAGINEVIGHGVAADGYDAAAKCLDSGVEVEKCSTHYIENLAKCVEDGLISIKQIDDAVLKVLEFKEKIGLLDDPYLGTNQAKCFAVGLEQATKKTNKDLASESIVLLENNNILPIAESVKKVAVLGPNADEMRLNGYWSCTPPSKDQKSLKSILGEKYQIINTTCYDQLRLAEADLIIYCGGEKEYYSGEAKSRVHLELDGAQVADLISLSKSKTPKAFLNYSGRGNVITEATKYCDAIMQVWFLGEYTTEAIFDVLTGAVSPSGKLPISMPRATGQLPLSYIEYSTGRYVAGDYQNYGSAYTDELKTPLYPFGYGLTYHKLNIDNINIEQEFSTNTNLNIRVNISNSTSFTATDVLQVYVRDKVSSFVRPLKELKSFEKVTLKKQSASIVNIDLGPDVFSILDQNFEKVQEQGEFEIMIGFNPTELIKINVELKG